VSPAVAIGDRTGQVAGQVVELIASCSAFSDGTLWRAPDVDGQYSDSRYAGDRVGGVTDFASDVVALLLSRGAERPAILDESLLRSFMDAVMSGSVHGLEDLRAEFRRLSITPGVLQDLYIPEAARRFGSAWLADEMSFCDVTIGSSRLQAILHDIAGIFSRENRDVSGGAVVLVVVPAQAQHTLGGLTLAGQLRRRGVSVCLQIGPTDAELRDLVQNRRFDGAMISVATQAEADRLSSIVNVLKADTKRTLPVAIGGSGIVEYKDQIAASGADIVTCDLNKAVDFMGVAILRPRTGRF
jgi:MerR family transcriptional regulator, light-induced transcriptional regulator